MLDVVSIRVIKVVEGRGGGGGGGGGSGNISGDQDGLDEGRVFHERTRTKIRSRNI